MLTASRIRGLFPTDIARFTLYTFIPSAHNSLTAFAMGCWLQTPVAPAGGHGIGTRSADSALGITESMAQLENIEAIEARLWRAADLLRSNSELASNEYFMPVSCAWRSKSSRRAIASCLNST